MRRTLAWLMLLASAGVARADEPGPTFGNPMHFTEGDGQSVYDAACAGCHMPNGRGAVGAATYPALAGDGRLAVATYPITRVLLGKGAMPPLGRTLSDAQVAAVVGYIRTSFGNDYTPAPAASDVAAVRTAAAATVR